MQPESKQKPFEQSVHILIVDDEKSFLRTMGIYLQRRGLNVTATDDPVDALRLLKDSEFHILITDIMMQKMDGLQLAHEARGLYPEISILLMTAYGTLNQAIQAVKLNAVDFLQKPLELKHLYQVVRRIINEKTILWENLLLKQELRERGYMEDFIGISRSVQKLYETIHSISQKETPISIEGESGTGKGLLARIIHKHSPRKDKPFVEVNVGAIVPQLMESELFGHVKGAFTGAIRTNPGILPSAHEGTLFLDEITEISPELQVKLLRVLQDKTLRPVGGKEEKVVDVRIITATNRPLKEAVESGHVREDFFYRIRVLPIWIPPLRERKEDIPVLVGHILKKLFQDGKSNVQAIDPEAMNALLSYDWPGNVRELENLLERCAATGSGSSGIRVQDLPDEIIHAVSNATSPVTPLNLRKLEMDAIKRALHKTANNKKQAAELLGIDKSTLHRKIRRHEID